MEGGLNSPSEILEPVGKPQLFKCRKSWFYKMLIWSALGTSEQNGSEQEPPHPTFIYWAGWRQGANERRTGECDKRREKRDKRRRRWRKCGKGQLLFCSLHAVLFTLHLLVNDPKLEKHYSLNEREKWQDSSMLNITLFSPYFFFFPYASHFPFLKIYQPPSPCGHMVILEAWEIMTAFFLFPALFFSLSLFLQTQDVSKLNSFGTENEPLLFFGFLWLHFRSL